MPLTSVVKSVAARNTIQFMEPYNPNLKIEEEFEPSATISLTLP